jgi:hypothetical protein
MKNVQHWATVTIFMILLVGAFPAYAGYIQIQNIGAVPITNISLWFEISPSNSGNTFYANSPGIPSSSNIYFPSNYPTIANPLAVGDSFNTFLIPELDLTCNIIGIQIDYRVQNGGMMGFAGNMNLPIVPGTTSIDWVTQYLPLAARFTFLPGGTPVPGTAVPEPSLLILLAIGISGVLAFGWKYGRG